MTAIPGRGGDPSPWVVRFARSIREYGTVLDVASGRGRHARWLEARGHRVTAIDRDADALEVCGATETIVFDLEAGVEWPLTGKRFDAVLVTNYLHRPLFPSLLGVLAEGGVLLYETFAVGNERFGKPDNPDFLLRSGELLKHYRGLDIVAFEDGLIGDPPTASIQRICAIRPSRSGPGRSRPAL